MTGPRDYFDGLLRGYGERASVPDIGFIADAATTIRDLINRHRGRPDFTDADRDLAIALDKVARPDAHRGNGVNALISQAVQARQAREASCERCHDLDPMELAEFRLWRLENDRPLGDEAGPGLPGVSPGLAQRVQDLQVGSSDQPQQFPSIGQAVLAVLPSALTPGDEEGLQRLASRHPRRNLQAAHGIQCGIVAAHHSLLALHGLVTRHVTGAFLAASRWLQRRAWVRRAVPSRAAVGHHEGGAR